MLILGGLEFFGEALAGAWAGAGVFLVVGLGDFRFGREMEEAVESLSLS